MANQDVVTRTATPGGRPRRADARRNYDQIVAAAEVEIARSGANASLEEIARKAGVGSATLHRHFPNRWALLDAVFHDRVEVLCRQADELADAADPGTALVDWLQAVAVYGATSRGLASAVLTGISRSASPAGSDCDVLLGEAAERLLQRAQAAGAVRSEVASCDLLILVNAVSLATETHPDAAGEAARLTALALTGIRA
ncbi:TetR family transcriptional regulator [Kineosporia sp. NBRC 101677]|uniref:TetR/AcrR family transcriptional regulator n=1 Tax=Kineosporia sp. NBRC 101677 TaxID=3032197 RepID=UPI00249FA0B6|nr:TetR/AcrR family transcriptional regulator [Kineosporia sp. NBRC 101677]GLY13702.1 TetR family transcriptional regulator [Kineosporia sp. NBRC 101677]